MGKLSLDRILQSQGFGTRKWCCELIAAGEVSISGKVITESHAAIETAGLEFRIYDESWIYREHVYVALNKPADFEELLLQLQRPISGTEYYSPAKK